MNELELKYGCNPNQKPARIFMRDGTDLPLTVLNGRPGYINFLDALNSWQLVRELKDATGLPARRVLQARLPRRGRRGAAPLRRGASDVLRGAGGRPVPPGLRLHPGKRGGPTVLLWGLGRPLRTCATAIPPGI